MIEFEEEWTSIYLTPVWEAEDREDRDLLQEFADACGITKLEAKELCYKNMFQPEAPWLVKRLLDTGREMYRDAKNEKQ